MKRILFITSQYRVGERIYPIIPKLAEKYELDLLLLYQMQPSFKWTGDKDLRILFSTHYLQFFKFIYHSLNEISPKRYDLIISDDNRNTPKTNLGFLYKKKQCPWIACVHGSTDKTYFKDGYKKCYDYNFVFGKQDVSNPMQFATGIPSNDGIKDYLNEEKKHALFIINFLENRFSPFKVNFGPQFLKEINLRHIQEQLNVPFVFKLKSRADENIQNSVSYLQQLLEKHHIISKIIVDCEDDNKLICQSIVVFSAPSTLAFKSIQAKIPTFIFRRMGQIGSFRNYPNLVDIRSLEINSCIDGYSGFIENAVEGGNDFNSSKIMLDTIKNLL